MAHSRSDATLATSHACRGVADDAQGHAMVQWGQAPARGRAAALVDHAQEAARVEFDRGTLGTPVDLLMCLAN